MILGAGTAGTMMANHLSRKIDHKNWNITIIDEHQTHYYQPGFLFIPFGTYTEKDVVRKKNDFIPKKVEYLQEKIEVIAPQINQIKLQNGASIEYNILIVATGSKIVPDEIEGLTDENLWRKDAFDFYTIEGAKALQKRLEDFEGGKFVVHIAEMPIKCPVAPLEFAFLADSFFTKKGIRENIEITYVTPLSGAFTKQNCSTVLGYLLDDKKIDLISDSNIERVDGDSKKIVSYDEKEIEFDCLVTIPTNMGDELIGHSDMGDELNFIPTHKHTLRSNEHENIFVIGDATDLPSSKAGSVAHFQAEILTHNVMNFINNKPLNPDFDGHANCFIESGFGKAFLIDFNYDIEPVEGKFPFPIIGPMSLLKESRLNHFGKLAFKWIYWNILLKGLPMPGIPTQMKTWGKKL